MVIRRIHDACKGQWMSGYQRRWYEGVARGSGNRVKNEKELVKRGLRVEEFTDVDLP